MPIWPHLLFHLSYQHKCRTSGNGCKGPFVRTLFAPSRSAFLGAPRMPSSMSDHMCVTTPTATAKSSVVFEVFQLILHVTSLEGCKWLLAPTVMNPLLPAATVLCVPHLGIEKEDLNGNAWFAKFLLECTRRADWIEMDYKVQMENKHFN